MSPLVRSTTYADRHWKLRQRSAHVVRRSARAVRLEVRTVLVCDILKTKGSVVMTVALTDSTLSLAERLKRGARIFTQSRQIGV